MYTLDTANTWTTLDTPFRRPVYDLVFTDSLTGYAVGDSGLVLKFKLPTVNVEGQALLPPDRFVLHQNYPNPFNPSTTISFDVPEESLVTIAVFDVLGREVRTLLHQRKEPGRHYVNFDGTGLASGVYVYSLKAGRFTAVRKMVLME
jgi:hypothetical protein